MTAQLHPPTHLSEIQYALEVTAKRIAEMTDRTMVLALETSIEAARLDKGAHKLANHIDEIRSLADQTRHAAMSVMDVAAEITNLREGLVVTSEDGTHRAEGFEVPCRFSLSEGSSSGSDVAVTYVGVKAA